MDNDNKRILAPLMDRLLQDSATTLHARPQAIIRQLRESVRRDLEALFNTRSRNQSPPKDCPQLQNSLLNYGLPDLSTVNFSSGDDRQAFCKQVEHCILNYEPRVKTVKVNIAETRDVEDPKIRFKVEAVLHANPAPETIVFDSAFNPVDQSINIAEAF